MTHPDPNGASRQVYLLGSLMVPAQPQFLAANFVQRLKFGPFKNSFYDFWARPAIVKKHEDPKPPTILGSHMLTGSWSDRNVIGRFGSPELLAVRLSGLWHVLYRLKLDTAVGRRLFPKDRRHYVIYVFNVHNRLQRITFRRAGKKWKFTGCHDVMNGEDILTNDQVVLIAPKIDSRGRRVRGDPANVVELT